MYVFQEEDHISKIIKAEGKWKIKEIEWVLEQLKEAGPQSRLLDLGANMGIFSIVAAKYGFNVTGFLYFLILLLFYFIFILKFIIFNFFIFFFFKLF